LRNNHNAIASMLKFTIKFLVFSARVFIFGGGSETFMLVFVVYLFTMEKTENNLFDDNQ